MSSLRTQRWALPSGRGVPEPVATRLAALFLADPVASLSFRKLLSADPGSGPLAEKPWGAA